MSTPLKQNQQGVASSSPYAVFTQGSNLDDVFMGFLVFD